MKKIVKILFAILLMSVMVLTISACTQAEDPCEKGYHAYTGVVTKEATCTQEGEITYTCARCSATYTDALPKIAHTPVTVEGKPATCKDAGLKDGVKCSVCNAVLTEQEALALVGHKFGDWQQKTAPTCDTDGVLARKCSVCDKEEERAIPAAHTWDTGKVTKVATCVDFGERQYTCTVCGETTTAVIARTDHSYGEWIEQVEPTFDQSGTLGHYTCSICGQYFDADHNLLEDLELIQTSARRVTINAAHATVTDLAGEALADRYEVGSHITFRVAPAYGFELTAVLINGKTVKPDAGIYLFDIAEADSSYTITVQTKAIDLSVRLTVDLDAALPSYLSVYFTGGSTTWADGSDLAQRQRVAVEGKLLEGTTSTYYFDIVLNMGKDQWNNYNLALGYSKASGQESWGLDYNFKSNQSGTYEVAASFQVEDGATVISLGKHTWSSMPKDPTPTNVTFAIEFTGEVPAKYHVWLVGGFGVQDGDYWWENGAMEMTATDAGRTKFTATATLAKGDLGVKVEFRVILTEGEFSWSGKAYGGTAGEYGNNAEVTLPADPQGEVMLFAAPQLEPKEVTFYVEFSAPVPAAYTVWLAGEMTSWGDNPVQMQPNEDRTKFSALVEVTAYGRLQFKVTIPIGKTFAWANETYLNSASGDSGGNGSVTVSRPGEVNLFKSKVTPPADVTILTLQVQFKSAVSTTWNIWYYGVFDGWTGTKMTSTDRITWSCQVTVNSDLLGQSQGFLVLALKTNQKPGDNWANKYGSGGAKGGNDASINIPKGQSDPVNLFGSTTLVLPS